MKNNERVEVTCKDCGKVYTVRYDTYRSNKNKSNDYHWRCLECRNKYFSKTTKAAWENLSPEEKERRGKESGERIQNYVKNLSGKELKKYKEKHSQGQKNRWLNIPKNEHINYLQDMRKGYVNWWNNLSEEELKEFGDKVKAGQNAMTEEEKQSMLKHRGEGRKKAWDKLSSEKRKQLMNKQHEGSKKWWEKLDPDFRQIFLDDLHNNNRVWRELMTDEEREEYLKKNVMSSIGNNNFHKKFEKAFIESHLNNSFYYIPEYPSSNNEITHCWDYAIFNENGDIVAVVDLDGAYYHADDCDYDGIHSKEEYDECRAQSVMNGIHHFIIHELWFKKGFEKMIQTIMVDYDQYVENTFKELRSQPFPYPHYSDIELMKSWDKLKRIDCNDKYHQDISLNTRQGDRLIQHFHQSIWHDHCDRELSPYEAWQDDDLLHEVIKNRIIYQTHLNPNKILQGFNIAKKAPKVSVFSAGRAKMIINKYLSEFDEIFDPFSGYSGRMLGAIACGKRYIGQDISERHVAESNLMIDFLRKYQVEFDATITKRNILKSSGKYQCLFTCPPYSNKEQWEDVPIDPRSCDDWIDECLKRFDCKRYVFVVDHTKKYKDNIAAEISNKSHFSNAKEYIIIIDKYNKNYRKEIMFYED